jgi:hypothetical protein
MGHREETERLLGVWKSLVRPLFEQATNTNGRGRE